MKITEVRIDKSLTVNLGDFNNVKVQVGYSAEVEPGDDPQEVFEIISRTIDDDLRRELSDEGVIKVLTEVGV